MTSASVEVMHASTAELPEDPNELRAFALRTLAALQDAQEQLRLLQRQRFTRKSEEMPANQLHLHFDEAERDTAEHAPPPLEAEVESAHVEGHERKKPKRRPLPEPQEVVRHELPDSERFCVCGHPLHEIGVEVSRQVDIIPAKIIVKQNERVKYGCRGCSEGIKTTPMPQQPIPKSLAAPGMLAYVATAKYADGLPLHRLEGILARYGIDLPRATLARWMVRVGKLVTPLINLLREELLSGEVVHCDETRLQVLKEQGRVATSLSWMWVQVRYDESRRIVIYNYETSRSAHVPERLFAGFKGYLQVDGLKSYNRVAQSPSVIRIGCWAHARRKFFDAFKATGMKKAKGTLSEQGLLLIRELYKIERRAKDATPEARLAIRQEQSLPHLAKIKQWLDGSLPTVAPKTLTGRALGYLADEWPTLVRFVESGALKIDNNVAENAIRPFVVGRKAWLFSDTSAGAHSSAAIYSLVETAKANGIDPYEYLRRVLTDLPAAKTLADFEALLPWATVAATRH